MNLIKKIILVVNNLFDLIFPENEVDLFLKCFDFDKLSDSARVRGAESCFYIFDYKNEVIKKLIWALKFKNKTQVAGFLGKVLGENLEEILIARESCCKEDLVSTNFLLIPIPIHKKRRQERGFNQCELICQSVMENYLDRNELGEKLVRKDEVRGNDEKLVSKNVAPKIQSWKIKLNYQPKILIRKRYTTKQSWSSKEERAKNIREVFEVPEKFRSQIIGRKIILIDDVVTTGSTIREARRTLLESGASLVIAISIAH